MVRYYTFRWILLIVLGLGIYAQTFSHGFVFDDHLFIVTNPYIRDLGHLSTIWRSFPATRIVGMYSFAINYQMGQLDPQGYHVLNFLIHLTATALVWLTAGLLFKIARGLGGGADRGNAPDASHRDLPFFVALIFLVHPCQTQAVTYITQRFEAMATVFYLASVYFFLKAGTKSQGQQRTALWILSGSFALLGITTKEVAFTIPAMILVAHGIFFAPDDRPGTSRGRFHRVKPYGVMFCAAAVFGLLFMKLVQNDLGIFRHPVASASHDGDVYTFPSYVLTQMRVFWTLIRLLVFPVGQNLDYDFPMSTGLFTPPSTALGLALAVLSILGVIRLRRSHPLVSFGLAWVLVTFSANIPPRANVIFEHKIYLISFGFWVAIAAVVQVLIKDHRKVVWGMAIVIAVMSSMAFNRNRVWRDEKSLWEDIYRKSPNKARVHANLGRVYGLERNYDKAFEHLDRAIALKPDDHLSLLNRGLLYREIGRNDRALEDIEKAINIDRRYFSLWTARAFIHMDRNDSVRALEDLKEAIRLKPDHPDAYTVRGSLWMRLGKSDEALGDLTVALKLDPDEYGALINRGAILYQRKDFPRALEDFRRAHRLMPGAVTLRNIGLCLRAMGKTAEAAEYFEQALRFEAMGKP